MQNKLEANLKPIKDLHEIYCIHRERGKDDASEEALLEKEEENVTELEFGHIKLEMSLPSTQVIYSSGGS